MYDDLLREFIKMYHTGKNFAPMFAFFNSKDTAQRLHALLLANMKAMSAFGILVNSIPGTNEILAISDLNGKREDLVLWPTGKFHVR